MRSYLPLILTMILLASLAFCSACMSQPATNQTPQQNLSPKTDVGLVPLNMSQGSEFVSFKDAIDHLKEPDIKTPDSNNAATRILFIQGGNLDNAGNAKRWVFGINKGVTNELWVYDPSGWTDIPYSGNLPHVEIVPSSLMFNPDMKPPGVTTSLNLDSGPCI